MSTNGKATQPVETIYIGQDTQDKLVEIEKRKRIAEIIRSLEESIKNRTDNRIWVRIGNKDVYYIGEKYNLLIADPTRDRNLDNDFSGYSGRPMSLEEAKFFFSEKKQDNPLLESNSIRTINNKRYPYIYFWDSKHQTEGVLRVSDGETFTAGYDHFDYIKIPVYNFKQRIPKIELFIKEELIPDILNYKERELIYKLSELYIKKNLKTFSNKSGDLIKEISNIILREQIAEELEEKVAIEKKRTPKPKIYSELNGISLVTEAIRNHIADNRKKIFDKSLQVCIEEEYLKCDYNRAEIDPYDIGILEDEERGHWELWGRKQRDGEGYIKPKKQKVIGRNPLADIQEQGIVGIDFGTNSTVVMYQNGDDNILPMRVGNGKYGRLAREADYENPTVMEFRNIEHFEERYRAKKGRPYTLWEDLTISHKAAQQLKEESDSRRAYSFFSELKQWCGNKKRVVRIIDDQKKERELPAYIDIKESDFDPIEIYAYYLGLYINNMRQKIYLNYLLSFPATYEEEVKEKIVNSFKKGIMKSLPEAVQKSKICKLDIQQWSSEPAAYAICALTEYGFKPVDGEKVFYGIFDFGGGTTDFDFGIWQVSKKSRYNYEIKHFGAGGDQYLGGEHLLEMLAFNVFKGNQEILLREGIPFYKPHGCKNFPGMEGIVCDSREANLNVKRMMEKLRGLWQNDNDEDIQAIEEGRIRLMLHTREGELRPNFELKVDKESLLSLLEKRIDKGVKNFFAAMRRTFVHDELKDVKGINIFLAGNSSKSPIVKELFEKYCQEWTEKIKEKYKKEISPDEPQHFFTIFPPLGTNEAFAVQERRKIVRDKNDGSVRPTGKTGVAYGLVLGRPGGKIDIIQAEKIKFKYYVGRDSRDGFEVVLDRSAEYNEWLYFIDASEKIFEFYYTDLPEDVLNKNPVAGMYRKRCRIVFISENEKIGVYIRAVNPTAVEYAVGTKEGVARGEYKEAPIRVELS